MNPTHISIWIQLPQEHSVAPHIGSARNGAWDSESFRRCPFNRENILERCVAALAIETSWQTEIGNLRVALCLQVSFRNSQET